MAHESKIETIAVYLKIILNKPHRGLNKLLLPMLADYFKQMPICTESQDRLDGFLYLLKLIAQDSNVLRLISQKLAEGSQCDFLRRYHASQKNYEIDNFKLNLAMSLSNIINILDPDCFVFGGGVSNEIDFLSEIETIVRKFVTGREYEGVFLKPKYGDASGVRGAARLGRKSIY
mgnify:CR=1 FL=1